jgi:predicted exporter
VGIDYSGHYIAHHVLAPDPAGPEGTMRKIWPGLLLGAGTTVLGLLGLGLTTLPGMQELGVFSGVGVLGALLATRLLPPWMPERPVASALHRRLAAWLGGLLGRLERQPRIGWALAGIALLVAAIGLPQLTFVDDLRALNEMDPAMSAEDQRVRERLARGEAGRVAVAIGRDDEEALSHAEAMTAALEDAVAAGELTGFRSASAMVRSSRAQREVLAAVTGDATLGPRVLAALEAEGFVPSMFAPFGASLAERVEPITPDALMETPLAPLLGPFRLEVPPDETHPERRIAYLALLAGIEDEAALAARLDALPGARFFDQGDYLHAAYRSFRERAMMLVLGGLLMVLGLCWARYRDLRMGLASIAPALLASAAALGLVALSGQPANLMHLVACLLVLSMGEDYAVFLLESKDEPTGPATTMVGLLIASLTTVLSFGLLAFSSHPALRALGIVTSLGVLLSLVLAPISLRLVAQKPR